MKFVNIFLFIGIVCLGAYFLTLHSEFAFEPDNINLHDKDIDMDSFYEWDEIPDKCDTCTLNSKKVEIQRICLNSRPCQHAVKIDDNKPQRMFGTGIVKMLRGFGKEIPEHFEQYA